MPGMGQLIDLASWRATGRRTPGAARDPLARLDLIVSRLDPLMEEVKKGKRRDRFLETEILAITGALSLGMADEAADRAERLVARLETQPPGDATPGG
jgi:hypothetical protein